jgi:hypothetical protein
MPIRNLPLPTAFGPLPKIREGRINRCSFSIGILLLRSLVHFVKNIYSPKQCTMVNAQWSIKEVSYLSPRRDTPIRRETFYCLSENLVMKNIKSQVHFVKFYYSRVGLGSDKVLPPPSRSVGRGTPSEGRQNLRQKR